jgi:hypothetical protein
MALFDWKNNEAGDTKVSASNLNLAQQKMVGTIYSVGSIYKSFDDTNPSELFGGTWETIKCNDLVDSGTKNGINYRIYSDGYAECWGANNVASVPPYTAVENDIVLPITYADGIFNISSSRIGGGAYWVEADYIYSIYSQNTIHLSVYNANPTYNAEDMTFSWKTSGYVANYSQIYAWKRTA